ncbi:DUF3953 domain-containing protein [Metabacillus fastidiosus]|uniref:DUF3953 domain-containing protein n=1 Tax=Metabacillus fastidiosus TaxID=1458 RepID=UPI003D2AF842
MLKVLRIVFAIIASFLGIYFVITNNPIIIKYLIFLVGMTFLLTGISELRENKKSLAYFSFILSGSSILVSVFYL